MDILIYILNSRKFNISVKKRPIFYHACARWFEKPFNISTMYEHKNYVTNLFSLLYQNTFFVLKYEYEIIAIINPILLD